MQKMRKIPELLTVTEVAKSGTMRLTLVFNLLLYSYIYWRGAQVRGGGSGGGQVPGGPVSGRGP